MTLEGDRPTEEASCVDTLGATPAEVGADTLAAERREEEEATEIAQRFGRYVLIRRLGAGGMGVVYLAYDPDLDRRVAIKVLRGSNDERATQRLVREASAMARVDHPNIVTVYDVGRERGRLYVAMEYVEGATIDDWVRSDAPDWRAVVDAHVQAGVGLAAAHAVGIIHRDVKHGNMLRGRDGRVRVLDLGLALVSGSEDRHARMP